ncbi:hypothetical protein [Lentzea sp. E54]|uniref:hypothetical protein n=1 Tax=Lentzea xerophila TaxID=3435883 RepID=UPI003DA1F96B
MDLGRYTREPLRQRSVTSKAGMALSRPRGDVTMANTRPDRLPYLWTVIGTVLSLFLALGLIGNLVDPNFDPNEVVLALLVIACALPAWVGWKLDARRRR